MDIIAKYSDGTATGTTLRPNYTRATFEATSFEEAHRKASTSVLKGGEKPIGHHLKWLFADSTLVWTTDDGWIRPLTSVE